MPRLYSMKALCAELDLSENTVRKLVRLGHLPPPRKVAGTIPRWTEGQVKGYLYALENGLLGDGCQEKKRPRKAAPSRAKPQNGGSEEGA